MAFEAKGTTRYTHASSLGVNPHAWPDAKQAPDPSLPSSMQFVADVNRASTMRNGKIIAVDPKSNAVIPYCAYDRFGG